MTHRARFAPALVAAALAAVPLTGADAQARLEVTPFAGYMIDFEMQSTADLTAGATTGRGDLRREMKGGPVFGARADVGLTRQVAVYASAARGESAERRDVFFTQDGGFPLGTLTFDGYGVWLLAGGVSVQPVGPLFRVYAGPALTRFEDPDTDESTDHLALHAGAALTFALATRVSFSAGVEGYYIQWDDDAIGEGFGAEFDPDVQAETESEPALLPVVRLGVTLRP